MIDAISRVEKNKQMGLLDGPNMKNGQGKTILYFIRTLFFEVWLGLIISEFKLMFIESSMY